MVVQDMACAPATVRLHLKPRNARVYGACGPYGPSMCCPGCGFENVADASFCGECATPLTGPVSCPSCGRANPPKQKFCNGCGQPVIRSADRTVSAEPRAYTPKHLAERILAEQAAM